MKELAWDYLYQKHTWKCLVAKFGSKVKKKLDQHSSLKFRM